MKKRWVYREFDPAAAQRLETEANLPPLLAVLLAQRGVSGAEQAAAFLAPSLDQLHDPYLLHGMRTAVERLRRAIANQEKILVYGDYDVDGTTAVVVLRKAIEIAGGSAGYHVPHRVSEGYGMREEVIERAAREDVKLLISVDTGIREAAVVDKAAALGVDVIITDHHLPEAAGVPRALAVLNPNQPGCEYPNKGLCGVGVAFKLAQALLAGLDWPAAKLEAVLRSMLKIVAIGTVADLVPLAGENRVIVQVGLDELRRPRHPGLKALLDVAGLSAKARLTAGDIGFRIGPRLNAAGRMDTARSVIELFDAADESEATPIAEKLDALNAERQAAEQTVVEDIVERLGVPPPSDVLPFLVAEGEGWHPGVIGIVASRIVERFHRPTLVLSVDPATGLATGSGRSIPGFHLLESLESLAPIFERFGGHRMAAGCTIRADRIEQLRAGLNEYAVNVLGPDDFLPLLRVDAELPFAAISDELMEGVGRLAPHGIGNPAPVFAAGDVRSVGPPRLLKEKHLQVRLRHESAVVSAVGWRMAELLPTVESGVALEAAFAVEADDYRGGWRLNLKDVRESSPEREASRAAGT